MIRVMSRTGILVPVLSGSLLALVGCGGTPEESPTPTAVPPTPTATPVPAIDDYFRVTSMAVGGEGEGVDLNGDGTVDNGIEGALTEISDQILAAVEAALTEASIEGAQAQAIMTAVEGILESTFSVDAMSEAINAPIDDGSLNYLMEFKETGSVTGQFDLNWSGGTFKNTGYAVGQSLGTQAGSIDASGNGHFGPGDLTLTLSFTTPNGEAAEPIELVLAAGITEVSGYNGESISDGVAGGAVEVAFLMGLVSDTIDQIIAAIEDAPTPPGSGSGSIPVPEINVDEVLASLETALLDQADLDLDGDKENDSFSMGLILDAAAIIVVE